ncbi:hypothetical protein I553_8706 [Mycobacterium xenopi 4042]|uniref:Uncharacterized protein n=1 Tax=Mycobacterium xenopi 4042 TaxID=1299334 RepID=X8CKL5_MYCXE|nr:hypothetical protein I553_8706 [Mycobacterium xenopi 4042]
MTRSRIEAFDQTADVLTELAQRLRAGSQVLQSVADAYVDQIRAPNGTEWQGEAATGFLEEALPDQQSVNRAVEHANAMADTAERGGDCVRGLASRRWRRSPRLKRTASPWARTCPSRTTLLQRLRRRGRPVRRPRWRIATTSRTGRPGWMPPTPVSALNSTPALRR